jgi:alkaline phosphatase
MSLLLLSLLACSCVADPPDSDAPDDTQPTDTQPDSDDTSDTRDTTDTTETGDTQDTQDTGCTGTPRIVLFIGDGMGFEHVAGAKQLAGADLAMQGLDVQGRIRTASLTGLTDSAASATTMATGHKTANGRLGMTHDEMELENLLEVADANGLSTGVVTNDKLWGATPASFLVHLPQRGDAGLVADQIASNLPDVLFGGGAGVLGGPLDALDVLRVNTETELNALTPDGRPIVGLFAEDTFPFVVEGYPEDMPTLAELTVAALDALDSEDGFLLVVEGARIDHASHGRMGKETLTETVAFDAAVAAALAWGTDVEGLTVLVTADHECGGLQLTGDIEEDGVTPATHFKWGDHTNADVPVYATGPRTGVLDQVRVDNRWIHAVVQAAILGEPVVTPETVAVVDGWSEELGAPVVTQDHTTSFGEGYNQLDALRITSDADGLRIGVDGVFEDQGNLPLVLIDLDYGQGTGWPGSGVSDSDGGLDEALSSLDVAVSVSGLGFDVAVGGARAMPLRRGELFDFQGLHGLASPWAEDGNLFWLHSIHNFDDGNVARNNAAAPDAGAAGTTEGGWEMLVPWVSLWTDGVPTTGLNVAVAVILTDESGSTISNQGLPSLSSSTAVHHGQLTLDAAVALDVDAMGAPSNVRVVP